MRKLFLSLALAGALLGQSVQPQVGLNFSTAAGNAPGILPGGNGFNNQTLGCTSWVLTYNSNGFSALSMVIQSAPDAGNTPGTWVTFAGAVSSGVNPNTVTTQAQTVITGYFPWIRVNLTSVTGSGSIAGALQCNTSPAPA